MRSLCRMLFVLLTILFAPLSAQADNTSIRIAAASDLKYALDEIISLFQKLHPTHKVAVTYGSSGKFHTQIENGAPFDLYFSADIAYPQALYKKGLAGSEVHPYALGRIVLWSKNLKADQMTLLDLPQFKIKKIAIANPRHAPYGKRAQEALEQLKLWDTLQNKLVYGENIAQTAQFIESGAADIGIIALSLALNPTLAKQGSYYLIPAHLHQPLEQGFMITKKAKDHQGAQQFAEFMATQAVHDVLQRYGFELPNQINIKQETNHKK